MSSTATTDKAEICRVKYEPVGNSGGMPFLKIIPMKGSDAVSPPASPRPAQEAPKVEQKPPVIIDYDALFSGRSFADLT